MAITIAGLRIMDFEQTQSEGEAAVLTVTTDSAGLASLAAVKGEHVLDGVPGLAFKGTVHGMPSGLGDRTAQVEFIAQPKDMAERLKQKAQTLRVLPYYDALFFGGDKAWGTLDENGDLIEDDRDPADALEARSAHYLIDPATHEISLSDVLEGGAGTILVDKVYNAGSLKPMLTGSVVNEVTADLTAEWTQAASGKVDVGPRITGAFGIKTLTLPDSVTEQGEIGNDSGWSIESAEFRVTESEAGNYLTGEFDEQRYVKRDANGLIIDEVTVKSYVRAPLKAYRIHAGRTWASYDYSQARRETVSLRMSSDAQEVLGDRVKERLGSFSLAAVTEDHSTPEWQPDRAYADGDRVQSGGKAYEAIKAIKAASEFSVLTPALISRTVIYNKATGKKGVSSGYVGGAPTRQWKEVPLIAALPDASSASYFDTDRGEQSIMHLALRMRAYLRRHMRAYSLTFRGPWETLCGVTLDHEVRVMHWSLPPGGVTGKVVSYRKVWRGSGPGRTAYVEVTLGLAAGGGTAAPEQVQDAGYSDAFETGYARASGARSVAAADVSVAVAGPAPVQRIDPRRLRDAGYAVRQVRWEDADGTGWQTAVANAADRQLLRALDDGEEQLPPTAAEAVSEFPTTYAIRMRKLHSGGVLVRRLKADCSPALAPRNIEL